MVRVHLCGDIRKGCALEGGVVRVHLHGNVKERVCSPKRSGQGSFAQRYEGKGFGSLVSFLHTTCHGCNTTAAATLKGET